MAVPGPSAHDLRDAELAAMASEIRSASRGVYGAPKVLAEIRKAGVRTSRKRAARIMTENGLAGTTRGCARRPKGAVKPAAPQAGAAPDLVGATSRRTARTGRGSPTSPTCALTRAGSTWPS